MSISLRDQLLQAGLVNEKQAKKAAQATRQKYKKQRKTKQKTELINPEQEVVQEEQAAKVAYDRELNQKMREKIKRKETAAQIKQLIERNKLPREEGDVAYNFADGRKIKRKYVTEATQTKLNKGQLAIVKLGDQYELVVAEIAKKIAHRDEKRVIYHNDPKQAKAAKPDETQSDDAYGEYQVPDDLMW